MAGEPTEARLNRNGPAASLTTLTVLVVVLFAVPSRLIFQPLGGAGSPSQIAGMLLMVTWVLRIAAGARTRLGPIRWAMLAFVTAVLVSYVAAATRPIAATELTSADRGLLAVVSWTGLLFTVADGLRTRRNLDLFLRRLCTGGGVLATIGLVQFVTKQQLTNYIQIPGLSDNSGLLELSARNGFARPSGTAIHPIEFGAVLTMILPIALHYAMTDSGRSMLSRWFPPATIAVAIPISISRSAIISAIVILAVVIPTWSRLVRRRAYGVILLLGAFIYTVVPGLLGTLGGLFTGISSDDSAKSRTGSYALAVEFIGRSPLFGRGFRTFLPSYRILDNQYLGLLIEVGVVGLLTLFGLFGTAMVCCWRIRRASMGTATAGLAQALLAATASTVISAAVFDALSFPMAATVFFLILGSVAALLRSSELEAQGSSSKPLTGYRRFGVRGA